MTQEVLNNPNNIGIAHGISAWFQRDFSGNYHELGDCLIDGVTLAPEFNEFESYRNSVRALRKKILTKKAASLVMTLHEPNLLTLQKAVYGGPIGTGNPTVFDGRLMTVRQDSNGLYVDFDDVSEFANQLITIVAIYLKSDFEFLTTKVVGDTDLTPDSQGRSYLGTVVGISAGDEVYVRYNIAETGYRFTEIFGAPKATIEGAAQVQVRNMSGGVVQIWKLASVQLAPNGDIAYPLDAIQTIPLLMTLQERAGTFGNLYTK